MPGIHAKGDVTMEKDMPGKNYFETSHLTILFCYAIFSALLIGEGLLLSWEGWALILVAAGVITCWVIHIRRNLPENTRIWIYAVLMMASTFFYGTHVTSTFDLGFLMTILILNFVSAGIPGLITLCQGTYYLAMIYDLFQLYRLGETFDSLMITRTILHLVVFTGICDVARGIMKKWAGIMEKSEEEKQELSVAAERLNDFLANISHEIRTPVNAVIGLSKICSAKVNDSDVERDLCSIMEAGEKIGFQITDILDYSEIDMGSLAVNEEDYMISSLLSDIVAEMPPLKDSRLELVIDVDPRIPSVMRTDLIKLKKIIRHLIDNALKYTKEGGVYVHITPEERDYGINLLIEVTDTGIGMSSEELEKAFDRFYQADSGRSRSASGLGLGLSIVNGFTRSLHGFLMIDSEPDEGTTVRVSIPHTVVGNEYCMSLRDPDRLCLGAFLNIEKYKNPHVREFYNAMIRDLVLGLKVKMHRADCLEEFKKLAKGMSFTHIFMGKEEYETDPVYFEALARTALVAVVCDPFFQLEEGSNIRLIRKPFYCFPVISFLNSDRADQEDRQGKLYARGIKALVVDDEPMNHTVAKQILKGYGMTVSLASSGTEAVEYAEKKEVDLVFMDHMMPGMDGVEAMKRMRSVFSRAGKDIPIVALTANAVSTANEMFLREGFDAFLAKPIVVQELERVLKKVLPKSSLTVENPDSGKTRVSGPENGNPKVSETRQEDLTLAKAPETSREDPDPLETLGIDTRTGLAYCQNDSDFYGELLLQYAGEASGKIREADSDLAGKDYKNYEVLVHAIKSTSKMIGASHLAEEALRLEMAAKENDINTIRLTHESAMEEYQRIADGILAYFGKSTAAQGPEEDILEFMPQDDIMEFMPEAEPEDGILEFMPEAEPEDDILEFYPEGSDRHE